MVTLPSLQDFLDGGAQGKMPVPVARMVRVVIQKGSPTFSFLLRYLHKYEFLTFLKAQQFARRRRR
jgi:hypothetical protein